MVTVAVPGSHDRGHEPGSVPPRGAPAEATIVTVMVVVLGHSLVVERRLQRARARS